MRASNSIVVLLALGIVVLVPVGAKAREQGPARMPSGSRNGSAVVRITVAPDIMPLDEDLILAILQHSGIARKAALETLGLEPAKNPGDWIKIEKFSRDVRRVGEPGIQPPSKPEPAPPGYNPEMLRELRDLYGPGYMNQIQAWGSGQQQKKDEVGPDTDRLVEQVVTFVLSVQLPEDIQPAAVEFLKSSVNNVRQVLLTAYTMHKNQIHQQLVEVESWRERAEDDYLTATGVRSPEYVRVQKQLDTVVDLSALSPQIPFSEAVALLQRSVEPPLQMVVLWRDLQEKAAIMPTAPISMDRLTNVKLGTALDVLLKTVGDSRTKLSYRIKGGVVTIGTAESLAETTHPAAKPGATTDVDVLNAERWALSRQIRSLELELTGLKARQEAISRQIDIATNQARETLAQDTVTQELQRLVQVSIANLAQMDKLQASGRANELEMAKLRESLARANIELARREEELRKAAGGGQVGQFNEELSRIEIDGAEKRAQLDLLRKQVKDIGQEIASTTAFDPLTTRLRTAREMLDAAERRVVELKKRLMDLREPTVTILDAS